MEKAKEVFGQDKVEDLDVLLRRQIEALMEYGDEEDEDQGVYNL